MKLGKQALEALQGEITGLLAPGHELVVVGAVALEGTALLARKEYTELRTYFSEGFLCQCMNLRKDYGIEEDAKSSKVWQMAQKAGASALYALNEGGILSALWKMAEASGVGLLADLRRIPIRQETIEVCERFDLNPYYLLSHGALLLGIPSGENLVQEYRRLGLPASVIGQTNDGNDRLLYSGENTRYLDRPARDEIFKMGWKEPILVLQKEPKKKP